MAHLKNHTTEQAGGLRQARKRTRRMTLDEVIAQYGKRIDPPGPGEKVLFECAGDYTGATINLGEVVATWAVHDSPNAAVLVMGIRTFFPNGKQQAFRGKSRLQFPAAHLMRPIEERLFAHALRWEQRAADTREWVESLRGRACEPVILASVEMDGPFPAPISHIVQPDNILPFIGVLNKP